MTAGFKRVCHVPGTSIKPVRHSHPVAVHVIPEPSVVAVGIRGWALAFQRASQMQQVPELFAGCLALTGMSSAPASGFSMDYADVSSATSSGSDGGPCIPETSVVSVEQARGRPVNGLSSAPRQHM